MPRLSNDDQQRAVDVSGHRIAYRIVGDGPPLVLLHGFLLDSRMWRTQLAGLADSFTIVAWDAPGAGASSDPPDPFTYADWADALARFLDATGIERAPLVGLSWGGTLALEFYRRYPARVPALVLSDTYAGWAGSFDAEVARQRLERCISESQLPSDAFVSRWVPREFFAEASGGLTQEMAAIVRDFHPGGFRLMAKSLADTDATELLPTIEAATLLLWGEQDVRSPHSVAESFRAAIPGSELVVIAGAGHVSNMERPEQFNAELRRFLSPR
jgi:pimeloyl-ACP methyl ester carboxylesterase